MKQESFVLPKISNNILSIKLFLYLCLYVKIYLKLKEYQQLRIDVKTIKEKKYIKAIKIESFLCNLYTSGIWRKIESTRSVSINLCKTTVNCLCWPWRYFYRGVKPKIVKNCEKQKKKCRRIQPHLALVIVTE